MRYSRPLLHGKYCCKPRRITLCRPCSPLAPTPGFQCHRTCTDYTKPCGQRPAMRTPCRGPFARLWKCVPRKLWWTSACHRYKRRNATNPTHCPLYIAKVPLRYGPHCLRVCICPCPFRNVPTWKQHRNIHGRCLFLRLHTHPTFRMASPPYARR